MGAALWFALLIAALAPPGRALAQTSKWSASRLLPETRQGFSVTALADGRVLVAGGLRTEIGSPSELMDTAYILDSSLGIVAVPGRMATARVGHQAVRLADGRVAIFGGVGADGRSTNAVEIFTPSGATGSFAAAPEGMTQPRSRFTATRLGNGDVLIAGGEVLGASGRTVASTVEIYRAATGAFIAGDPMTVDRTRHTATLLADGAVALVGGEDASFSRQSAVDVYLPDGTRADTFSLGDARSGHQAVRLADGRVLVVGGGPSTARLIDRLLDSVSLAGGEPLLSREDAAAVLLATGKVLIAGGFVFEQFLIADATAELFDPLEGGGSFALTDPPLQFVASQDWFRPEAVLLPDGRVMVVGQMDGFRQWAQIYRPDPVRGYVARPNGDIWVLDTATNSVARASAIPAPGGYGVAVERGRVFMAPLAGNAVVELDPAHIDRAYPDNVLRAFSGFGALYGIAASIEPGGPGRVFAADDAASGIGIIDVVANAIHASSPIPLAPESGPYGIDAESPTRFAATQLAGRVSVVDTSGASASVGSLDLGAGASPYGIALNPRLPELAYAALYGSNELATLRILGTVIAEQNREASGVRPVGVAVTPDGLKVYVANTGSNDVAVFDGGGEPIRDDGVPRRIGVGLAPGGLALTPDGRRLYVVNSGSPGTASLSVIDTATDTVIAGPPLAGGPVLDADQAAFAFGKFIGRFDTPGPATSDLKIDALVAVPADPSVGNTFDYRITVRNDGPDIASAVALDVSLPPQVSFSTIQSFGAFHACVVPSLRCVMPSLGAGQSTTFEVRVTAEASGQTIASAAVSAFTMNPDPTPEDNAATVEVAIAGGGGGTGSADLSIAKAASADTQVAGRHLTYTISVENAGPSAAASVEVTDALPAGVTLVSASAECSGVSPGGTGTLTCGLGTIAFEGSASVTVVVSVAPTATAYSLGNTASVTSDTADPVPGNNASTATTQITAASLSGRVTRVDGVTPIAGATVRTHGPVFFATQTGPDGRYAFDGLPAGSYRIAASATDFQTTWHVAAPTHSAASLVSVSAGTVATGVDVRLAAGAGGIAGRVTSGGVGVAGASVNISLAGGGFVMSATTGPTGTYDTGRVLAPGAGRYIASVSGAGLATLYWNNRVSQSAADPISVSAGSDTTGIDFAVSTSVGGFRGVVTDGPGGPGIPGVDVQILDVSGAFVTSTLTDLDGRYDVSTRLATGRSYKILARVAGFVSQYHAGKATAAAADEVLVANAEPVSVNLALQRGGGIVGRITSGGAPVAGALVDFFDAATNTFREQIAADSQGNFTAERRLQPGVAYKIRARSAGLATAFYDGKLTLATADAVTAGAAGADASANDFALAAGGRVTGRVTETGPSPAGVAGAIVELFDAATNAVVLSATTAADGTYDTGATVPALSYRVRARKPGYIHTLHPAAVDFVTATVVGVAGGSTVANVDIALPRGGTITGTVRERGTNGGTPLAIPGATVTVFRVAANTFQGIFTATTDADGRFTIQGLRDGEWYLRASKPGFVLGFWTGDPNRLAVDSGSVTAIRIAGANTVADVDLNLAAGGGTLQGRVTRDDNGQPVPAGTTVTVRGLYPQLFWNGFVTTATTDASGGYLFTGLPAGHYIVEASGNQAANGTAIGWYSTGATSFADAEAVAVVDGALTANIDFAIAGISDGQSPRTISGTVRASGQPVAFAQVGAYDPFTQNPVRFTTTNGDGTYTLNQLRPDRYRIRVFTEEVYETQFYAGQRLTATGADVDVTGGNRGGIDFALAATAGTMTGRITHADTGEPIGGAQISVRNFFYTGVGGDTSDVTGGFLARGLPAGLFRVRVSAPGFITRYYTPTGGTLVADEAAFVAVTSGGETPGIDVALEPGGGSIAGTLLREIEGSAVEPAARGTVTVRQAATGAIAYIARIDVTGAFEAPGLAPGQYKVFFFAEDAAHQWYDATDSRDAADLVTVEAGAATSLGARTLSRAHGAISGRVFQSDGVTPLADAGVVLLDPATGAFVRGLGVTDTEGRFSGAGFPPGAARYVAEARALGFSRKLFGDVPDRASATRITVVDGAEAENVNISLAMTSTVSGVISYGGAQSGALHVGLYRDAALTQRVYSRVITGPAFPYEQPYDFASPPPDTQGVVPGTYYLGAFLDGNGNGARDPGEASGQLGAALVVAEGASLTGRDLALFDAPPTTANGAPLAIAREVRTTQNAPVDITLIGADAETAAEQLTYAIVEEPVHGTLSEGGQILRYIPNEGFTGLDRFSFVVTDRGSPDGCGAPGADCAAPLTSAPAGISIVVSGTSGTTGSALSAPVIAAPPEGGMPSAPMVLGDVEIAENSAGQFAVGSRVVVSLPPGLTFAAVPAIAIVVSNGLDVVATGADGPRLEPGNAQFSFAIAQPSVAGPAKLRISSISAIVAPGFVTAGLAERIVELTIAGGGASGPPLTVGVAVGPSPVPRVGGLSIAALGQGVANQPLVITGANFGAGASVSLGEGVAVAATAVDNPGQITASVTVAADAEPGERLVTVTNPGGQSTTFAQRVLVSAAPVVTGTNRTGAPATNCTTGPGRLCVRATNQFVSISGANFQDGMTIEFGGAGDIQVLAFGRYSSTELWADVQVADTEDRSSRTVTVLNQDGGRGTSAGPVVDLGEPPADAPQDLPAGKIRTVKTAAAPTSLRITALSRTSGVVGDAVTLSGSFGSNAAAVVVNFAGPGTTRVPAPVASFASNSVRVTVPAGAVDGAVTANTVTTGVVSNGVTFAVTDPRLALVLPRSVRTGSSAQLGLVGSKFFPGAAVSFEPPDGITAGAVSISADGTQITVPIAVAGAAAPGPRSVTVRNPATAGGTASTLLKAFEIAPPLAAELRLSLVGAALESYLPRVEGVTVALDAAGRCTAKVIAPGAVGLRAEFVATGATAPPARVTFRLASSAIPGTAFNEDCEVNPAAPAPDFSVAHPGAQPDGAVQTLTVDGQVGPTGAVVYEVVLHAWDHGGSVTVNAEGALAGGASVTGTLSLPLDTDGDALPDAYESNQALNGATLNALNPDQNANGVADRDDRFARDGLSNFEKYRGVYLRGPARGQGPMSDHVRLGAGMRHLFVRGVGFGDSSPAGFCGVRINAATGARDPAPATADDQALGCPRFQVGLAFQNIGVEVHNVSASFGLDGATMLPRRSLIDPAQPLLDMAEITFVAGCYGSEQCHISKFGTRQWQFPTLGINTAALSARNYGTDTKVYKGAFEAYFTDRPYEHRTNDPLSVLLASDGTTPMLAPIASVGDSSSRGKDNGLLDTGERLGADGRLAGDTFVDRRFDLQLTVMDSNNDRCVELPFVADPTTIGPRCDPAADYGSGPLNGAPVDAAGVTRPPAGGVQATRQQAVRAIITHELGHATGANHQSGDPDCIMYGATINWTRDHRFSPAMTAPAIQIHNKGGVQ